MDDARPSDEGADRENPAGPGYSAGARTSRIWIERLQLTDFRNYSSLSLTVGTAPVVLTGPNGSGKTNLLEAVSLLTSGQGLRKAPYPELTRLGRTSWAVAARLVTPLGLLDVGTGLAADTEAADRASRTVGRLVRIGGETQSGSGALADHVGMIWLTPAMDGLFTGPASERRRFLDRLISGLDPNYRRLLGQFERAMQQRNRLLADDVRDGSRFEGFERIMAEAGVAVAAARSLAIAELTSAVCARREAARGSLFPWAEIAVVGTLEAGLAARPAVDVEDDYVRSLAAERERDRAAGRALDGPHRSDLVVGHGPKEMPAKVCSTGEQKALLIGLVLAHCDLVCQRRYGAAPILLLDEIAAHLDGDRRAALFEEIVAMGSQTWMSGTDPEAFSALRDRGQFYRVEGGRLAPFG
jgi:DNA replication and repair protein RecF